MLQRRTLLLAAVAAATPAYATPVPLPPSLDDLSTLPLQTFNGEATTLGRNLRPGPAVISFWASWCAPCVEEAMHLSTIRHRYDEARLNIIGLNVELMANEEGVRRFLDQTRPTYTQLRADVATYHAFGGEAQLNLPRLFIFDVIGRPTAAFGAFDAPTVNRAIASVVSSLGPPALGNCDHPVVHLPALPVGWLPAKTRCLDAGRAMKCGYEVKASASNLDGQ